MIALVGLLGWQLKMMNSQYQIYSSMKRQQSKELHTLFENPLFAWELLEWEIAIEMNDSLSGQAIAKLLELYMKGVEVMNSCADIRECYFKNKVTSLMMRGNVVKSLNHAPPMAKKKEPMEAAPKKKTTKSKRNQQQAVEPIVVAPKVNPSATNTFALKEKKRQIQMRLAYESQGNVAQNLNTMIKSQQKKEARVQHQVSKIMNSHEERLRERIERRRIKTTTQRSPPEDTNDTSVQFNEGVRIEQKPNSQEKGEERKRIRSEEAKARHDLQYMDSPSPKRRKRTIDISDLVGDRTEAKSEPAMAGEASPTFPEFVMKTEEE